MMKRFMKSILTDDQLKYRWSKGSWIRSWPMINWIIVHETVHEIDLEGYWDGKHLTAGLLAVSLRLHNKLNHYLRLRKLETGDVSISLDVQNVVDDVDDDHFLKQERYCSRVVYCLLRWCLPLRMVIDV